MTSPEQHQTLNFKLPHPLEIATYHSYPQRQWVDPNKRNWDVELPDYNPPSYTSPKILDMHYPDADPPWETIAPPFLANYQELGYLMGDDGPRHPNIGRTGLTGRGEWPRYGPNYATDLAYLRIVDGMPYMLAVLRADSGKPGFAGGKIKRSDHPRGGTAHYSAFFDEETRLAAARIGVLREVSEETGIILPKDAELKHVIHSHTGGHRTTDVSWAETDVWTLIESASNLPTLDPDAIEDKGVLATLWLPVTRHMFPAGPQSVMHAAHGPLLEHVTAQHGLVVPREWSGDHLAMIAEQLLPDIAKQFLSRHL